MSTQITIVGNLVEDPELRFTPAGVAVAKFRVAVNRRSFNRETNVWEDAGTDFHRVTVWRQLAEHVAESLEKGVRVIVQGDMRQHEWTDQESGKPRRDWEVNATAVGPDLTWAMAKVTRVKGGRQDGPADDSWATASKQRPANFTPAGGTSEEPPF